MGDFPKRIAYRLLKAWFFHVKGQDSKSFYRVMGLRRSGNHAVINWLLAQLQGPICFNNNMGHRHPPENTPIKKLLWHGRGDYRLVVSHEDKALERQLLDYREDYFGKSNEQFQILILRDPFNLLASRYAWKDEQGKRFREDSAYRTSIIDLWKSYAHKYLEWERTGAGIGINYNQWYVDKAYRKEIAERLGLRFTDKGRDEVKIYGHGSSFDGTQKKGGELKVLERWKNFNEDSAYLEGIKDKDMIDLSLKIFGKIEGTETLYANL